MKTKLSKFVDIKRIEFFITRQCGGKCRHCQSGDDINTQDSHPHVLQDYAVQAVKQLASAYEITSVMTFGGEPLYYPDVTAAIHEAAATCGIKTRQLITSGYFTNDAQKSEAVARALANAGVNHLLLSVDAFHQAHIPLEPVYQFARDVVNAKIPGFYLYPAWLVSEAHQNPYNTQTTAILEKFSHLGIPVERGNTVQPTGHAAKFLRAYYEKPELNLSEIGEPCLEPLEITSVSIVPNGDVEVCGGVLGNIYKDDILDRIAHYNPYQNEIALALIQGGVSGLLAYAKTQGVVMDTSEYCEACWGLCQAITTQLKLKMRTT
jgi:MoaA/NifB/PqqE/SkfB family radical SAM enzyme